MSEQIFTATFGTTPNLADRVFVWPKPDGSHVPGRVTVPACVPLADAPPICPCCQRRHWT